MKPGRCVSCNRQKGRRDCLLHEGAKVCSTCCATTRTKEKCEGCTHLEGRSVARERPSFEDVVVEIDEDLENEVDEILEQVGSGRMAYEVALQKLGQLRTRNPGNFITYFALGTVHGLLKNNDEAITHFDRCISINPLCVEAYVNKAAIYQKTMDITNTIKTNWQILDITKPGDRLRSHATSLIKRMKRMARADAGITLEAYVEAGELFAEGFRSLEEKRFEDAIKLFEQALTINSKHCQSYSNLGICYAQIGKKAKALEMLGKALKLDSSYQPAIMNYAAVERMEEGVPIVGIGVGMDYSRGMVTGDFDITSH